jgi:uncharacterized RDD family membrane protein YckC
VSYPPPPGPNPNNPYEQQPPQQPYGYPQQPPQVPPQGGQPAYGYPQQAPQNPYGQQAGQPGYGYPQQAAPGYGYPQQGAVGYGYAPQYAGWGSRVGSYLLDALIVGVPYGILYGIGASFIYDSPGLATTFMLLGFAVLIGLLLWICYKEGTTGQTPGKKVLGTATLSEATGQPIGFGMAFVRKLAHFLDGICYIGYLWPLWDSKRQTLADKICSTVVVPVQPGGPF